MYDAEAEVVGCTCGGAEPGGIDAGDGEWTGVIVGNEAGTDADADVDGGVLVKSDPK